MSAVIETTMFDVAMDELVERIKADYANWGSKGRATDNARIHAEMTERFNNGIRIEEGRKYIKVITNSSVWGFIVKKDGGKFRAGDILKAASWSAPAMNSARGNVFDEDYSISWTGPHYLK